MELRIVNRRIYILCVIHLVHRHCVLHNQMGQKGYRAGLLGRTRRYAGMDLAKPATGAHV